MNRHVVKKFTGLGIPLADTTILVARNDVLARLAPSSNGSLALVANNGETLLVGLLGVDIWVDVNDDDVAQKSHTLLGNAQQLCSILVELNALDSGGELPGLEAAASLDFPQANGVVGGARGNHGGSGVDIDSPDSTNMAVVCAETLAIVREPGADLLILGDGEEDVAVQIIPVETRDDQLATC